MVYSLRFLRRHDKFVKVQYVGVAPYDLYEATELLTQPAGCPVDLIIF